MEIETAVSRDPFLVTVTNVLTTVVTKVTPELETKVGQWFQQDLASADIAIDTSEKLEPPPSAAFYDHTAYNANSRTEKEPYTQTQEFIGSRRERVVRNAFAPSSVAKAS